MNFYKNFNNNSEASDKIPSSCILVYIKFGSVPIVSFVYVDCALTIG